MVKSLRRWLGYIANPSGSSAATEHHHRHGDLEHPPLWAPGTGPIYGRQTCRTEQHHRATSNRRRNGSRTKLRHSATPATCSGRNPRSPDSGISFPPSGAAGQENWNARRAALTATVPGGGWFRPAGARTLELGSSTGHTLEWNADELRSLNTGVFVDHRIDGSRWRQLGPRQRQTRRMSLGNIRTTGWLAGSRLRTNSFGKCCRFKPGAERNLDRAVSGGGTGSVVRWSLGGEHAAGSLRERVFNGGQGGLAGISTHRWTGTSGTCWRTGGNSVKPVVAEAGTAFLRNKATPQNRRTANTEQPNNLLSEVPNTRVTSR